MLLVCVVQVDVAVEGILVVQDLLQCEEAVFVVIRLQRLIP